MFRVLLISVCLIFSVQGFSGELENINKNLTAFDQISDLSVLNQNNNFVDFNFSGIIKLSNCSASLVKLKGYDTDKALMLTNGHCMSRFQKPGEVILNKKTRMRANLMDQSGNRVARLNATKILYATMSRTDMALLELDTSYDVIKSKYGIEPLMISELAPVVGAEIEIISGYWKRGFSCAIENIVYNLKEADWDFL